MVSINRDKAFRRQYRVIIYIPLWYLLIFLSPLLFLLILLIYIPLWYLLIIDPGADDFCAYPFTFHYGIY